VRRGFAAREGGRTITREEGAEELIAQACAGDARKALNTVEAILAAHAAEPGDFTVTAEEAAAAAGRAGLRYDRDGDAHYDILSAFQKSIRGSDPDAALHYLARLLESGDILSTCRRLSVIAAEDIGLAYPQAIAIVQGCIAAAERLGLPEARIPLAEAAILLATAPKSNSAICAIDAAIADVRAGKGGAVPEHLRDSHYGGAEKLGHGQSYRYPHSAPRHYLPQQYLPDALAGSTYYEYGDNKTEQAARRYWDLIKGGS